MKRLALILVLALLGSLPAAAGCKFQAAGTAANGTGAISPAWPAHQTNDIGLLVGESANETISLSTAAGFGEVTNSPQGTGTGGSTTATKLAVFWARATSGAMGAPTIADPGDHVYGRIITFRGCISTGDPWDVTDGGVKSSASTTSTFGAVTTTVANTLIVLISSRENDATAAAWSAWTNSNLANVTERADGGTTSGNGGGVGVATGDWASTGSTGSSTATVTSTIDGHMTIALKAEPPPTACTVAPCPTLVQDVSWGTNDGGLVGRYWYYHLPMPVLSGNVVVCGLSYDTTSVTAAITDNIGSNTWTNGPTSNDSTRLVRLIYSLNTAAGTQDLTVTLSAAEYNVHFRCSEFYNVATSSAVDGTATSASGLSPPSVASGAITTTQDGSLLYQYVVNDAAFCCTNNVTSFVANGGFSLLVSDRQRGHAAQYFAWASHGALDPTMTVNQASADTFGSASIAFKAATAGTAPSGIRIVHEYHFVPPNAAGPLVVQFPCSGNLEVASGSTAPAQFDVTGITPSDGSAFTGYSATGYPQMFRDQTASCASPNTRTLSVAYTDHGSPDPMVLYDIAGADASAYDATMGVVTGTGNQSSKAASNTTCANNASYNSTVNATPSTSKGIMFVAENNGEGPECGASSAGNVFDSVWFQTEDDACCGMLDSSSGFMHILYSTSAQQTATFNWANSGATTASGWAIAIMAFKEAAAPSGVRKRVIVTE